MDQAPLCAANKVAINVSSVGYRFEIASNAKKSYILHVSEVDTFNDAEVIFFSTVQQPTTFEFNGLAPGSSLLVRLSYDRVKWSKATFTSAQRCTIEDDHKAQPGTLAVKFHDVKMEEETDTGVSLSQAIAKGIRSLFGARG